MVFFFESVHGSRFIRRPMHFWHQEKTQAGQFGMAYGAYGSIEKSLENSGFFGKLHDYPTT